MTAATFRAAPSIAVPAAPTAPADPLAVYGLALRQAARGGDAELRLIDPAGVRAPIRLIPADWCSPMRAGDDGLLARCTGPTLDVGCGPGRLAAALALRAIPSLGIDISAEAVRQARRRGARARLSCVMCGDLGPTWQQVLLADGNIGIAGDPVRLLARCRDLLAPGGDVLVELDAPGSRTWAGQVSFGLVNELSAPFAWAVVSIDDIAGPARTAGLAVRDTWTEAGRWFARLCAA